MIIQSQTTFTEIVCNNGNNSNPQEMTEYNGKIYFSTGDSATGRELWVTDGTQAGTHLVKDIYVGKKSAYPNGLLVYNGKLYFFATDKDFYGMDLYVTDGTSAGTQIVKSFPDNSGGPEELIIFNNKFYFNINDTADIFRLWASDGTVAGTQLVMPYDKSKGGNGPNQLTLFNGQLFFTAMNTTYGRELWVTDGTATGTKMVKDIYPGTIGGFPSHFVHYNNKLYFNANDGINGSELWETDGTTLGTSMLKDINNGSNGSYPNSHVVYNGQLYFQAADNATSREELWVTDGTAAGTKLLKEINAAFASYPTLLNVYKNKIYFRANDGVKGDELWVSDGTSAGTYMLKDINPGYKSSNIYAFSVLNNILYFVACPDPNFKEYTIYQSDGTDTGTKAIAPNNKTYGAPFDYQYFFDGFKHCNGSLYFTAWYNKDSVQLWYLNNKPVTTGLKNVPSFIKNIFPNPTNGILNIKFKNRTTGMITLSDNTGKEINNIQLSDEYDVNLDMSGMNQGVYLLNIRTVQGNYIQKVVKE